MSKDPCFPFYTQDFIVGTLYMTDEECGKYIKLLCSQHQHGGFIEHDIFEPTVGSSKLLRSKFIETPEGFYNPRLMGEMEKRQNKSNNLSANALKRWTMQKDMQLHCKSTQSADARQMPSEIENEIENNKCKNKNKKNSIINNIYSAYPKKEGRGAALKAIEKAITKIDAEKLLDIVKNYSEKIQWKEKRYIPQPATWFNGERWADDQSLWENPQKNVNDKWMYEDSRSRGEIRKSPVPDYAELAKQREAEGSNEEF
jgi:uncharacterized protein YdaU (DUF1376 family)